LGIVTIEIKISDSTVKDSNENMKFHYDIRHYILVTTAKAKAKHFPSLDMNKQKARTDFENM
jgi:hypothetical protein